MHKPRLWPYVIGWLLVCALLITLLLLASSGQGLAMTRIGGLLTYLATFSTILSSAYVRPLAKRFRRPFIAMHHTLAYTALAMATLHPLGAAISGGNWGLLLPQFGGWLVFFTFAGAPAAYCFYLGAIAARLRAQFVGWRIVHALNFVAFWLATAHALLLGSDTQGWIQRIVAIAMALTVLFVLYKRRAARPQLAA